MNYHITPVLPLAPNAYDASLLSADNGHIDSGVVITEQAHAEAADINHIVRQFGLGKTALQPLRQPLVGDFTHVTDFHSAMEALIASKTAFESLPATARERFRNDPGEFMDFISDPSNQAEAEKLGLTLPSTGSKPEPVSGE